MKKWTTYFLPKSSLNLFSIPVWILDWFDWMAGCYVGWMVTWICCLVAGGWLVRN